MEDASENLENLQDQGILIKIIERVLVGSKAMQVETSKRKKMGAGTATRLPVLNTVTGKIIVEENDKKTTIITIGMEIIEISAITKAIVEVDTIIIGEVDTIMIGEVDTIVDKEDTHIDKVVPISDRADKIIIVKAETITIDREEVKTSRIIGTNSSTILDLFISHLRKTLVKTSRIIAKQGRRNVVHGVE